MDANTTVRGGDVFADLKQLVLSKSQLEALVHNLRVYAKVEDHEAQAASACRDYAHAVDHDVVRTEYESLVERIESPEGDPLPLGIELAPNVDLFTEADRVLRELSYLAPEDVEMRHTKILDGFARVLRAVGR